MLAAQYWNAGILVCLATMQEADDNQDKTDQSDETSEFTDGLREFTERSFHRYLYNSCHFAQALFNSKAVPYKQMPVDFAPLHPRASPSFGASLATAMLRAGTPLPVAVATPTTDSTSSLANAPPACETDVTAGSEEVSSQTKPDEIGTNASEL